MPLAGIRLVRQTFADLLPEGWSVAQAYMRHYHDEGGESQVLTFHVIDPRGSLHEVRSDKVPSGDDINALAAATAEKFLKGAKDGPPTGIDPKNDR